MHPASQPELPGQLHGVVGLVRHLPQRVHFAGAFRGHAHLADLRFATCQAGREDSRDSHGLQHVESLQKSELSRVEEDVQATGQLGHRNSGVSGRKYALARAYGGARL